MRFLRTKYEYTYVLDSGKWRCSLDSPTQRKMSCHPCGQRNPGRGAFNVSMLFFATETIQSIRFLAPAKKTRSNPKSSQVFFKNYEFQ